MNSELTPLTPNAGETPQFKSQPFWRRTLVSRGGQVAIDASITALALVLAQALRFNGIMPYHYFRQIFFLLPYVVVLQLAVNLCLGVYRQIWRYISIFDCKSILLATCTISLLLLAARVAFPLSHPVLAMPIGAIVINAILCACGTMAVRLSRRILSERSERAEIAASPGRQRVVLVGAGQTGVLALREFTQRPDLGMEVWGFVDDDRQKLGLTVQGVMVRGRTADIPTLVAKHKIDLVIITMASAPRRMIRRVVDLCATVPVPVRIVPGLYEILGNKISFSNFRPVEIEDLLGREGVNFDDIDAPRAYCAGRKVLVTGGAGSIGRELCRQVAMLGPSVIYLLDKDENSVFEVMQVSNTASPEMEVPVVPVIADLRMRQRLNAWFKQHRPEVVFHAAAHKHVPLMESNVCEAVLNNLLGTDNLLAVTRETGVRHCVMVSTDKAVNPTNVMGATKRIAELMFQAQARRDEYGSYSCVRFGNVLGSRGSVVPTFHEQIRRGGPVTVTDPAMSRYFMTIPEAVQLIIQAGSMGRHGEVFMLDMGQPVSILDLAKDMIRLSGLRLGDDIEIEITGPRPGEKTHEEMFRKDEASETRFEKIFVAAPKNFDMAALDDAVERLIQCAMRGDETRIRELLTALDIGYHLPEAIVASTAASA